MSRTSAQETAEAKELSLINKVETRIALADTDAKLESLLKTYLAPLLLKLASEHVTVRKKVISVCQHIYNRVKPQTVRLPVAALLRQYKEQESALVHHFDLIYIQQGIDRTPAPERIELVPLVVKALAAGLDHDYDRAPGNGAVLFHLLVKLLHTYPLSPQESKEDVNLRDILAIDDRIGRYLSYWFGRLLLLTSITLDREPGLNTYEKEFLTLDGRFQIWNPRTEFGLNLTESKVIVIKFLASGAFTDSERFAPSIYASTNPNQKVSDIGKDILKRTIPDWRNLLVFKRLFEDFTGVGTGAPPARAAVRIEILNQLAKLDDITGITAEIRKLIEVGIQGSLVTETDNVFFISRRDVSRLRSATFQYINYIARTGHPQAIRTIAEWLVWDLKRFIEKQGWPTIATNTSEDLALRAYAYEMIGVLAGAGLKDRVRDPEMYLLTWLFNCLSADVSGGNVLLSIEEAMSACLSVLASPLEHDAEEGLRNLLLLHMGLSPGDDLPPTGPGSNDAKAQRSTQYMAVRFANRCLPYGDVMARFIDILGLSYGAAKSKDSQNLVEEARKGLDPYSYRMLNSFSQSSSVEEERDRFSFPDSSKLLEHVFLRRTDHDGPLTGGGDQLQHRHVVQVSTAVNFCQLVLLNEILSKSGLVIDVDVDWERKLDVTVRTNEAARQAIRENLTASLRDPRSSEALSLRALLAASFHGFTSEGGDESYQCGERFLQLCSLSPDALVAEVAPRFRNLETLITSNNEKARTLAAQAFGVLASHTSCSADETRVSTQILFSKATSWRTAVGGELNKVHGAIISLAHFVSRAAHRQSSAASQELTSQLIQLVFEVLLGSKDRLLQDACLRAIDQLCLFSVLTPATVSKYASLDGLINTVNGIAQTGRELAISVIGHIAMIMDEDEPELTRIVEDLRKMHELRQAEVQLAVGEALSCVACGWHSKALISTLDVDGPPPKVAEYKGKLARIVNQVLEDCKSTKPALKKASCIWLLCLVQHCGHLPEMQERLAQCQAAFAGGLSDRDDLVQDTASRGLGLVYERGSPAVKDTLIRSLLSSFTSNNVSMSGSLADSTQLFEPGTLPTGDGSISTYKDIMSLAAEVGDPSLVYRFMGLARSNAFWQSRAAFGHFGLVNALSDPGVKKYLSENPNLYAKLYRYRFDPNPNVQRSMKNIWDALIKDPASLIDRYFEFILQSLLADSSILGKEWRQRQASCAALADLLQQKPLDQWQSHLESIFGKTFKVLDDIKDSVRVSAAALIRILTGILTRNLKGTGDESTKNAGALLMQVLPFLLSASGIESSAKETQLLSLSLLLEIIKESNIKVLQPFIAELIERLLGLLSSMEPEALNYLQLNSSRYNLADDQIDTMRLSAIRESPLMEAIERCIDLLEEGSMAQLSQRLENAIKTAVGIPSKLGCSRVLVSLATRRDFLFQQHAEKFLRLLPKYIFDRNDTVASSYAAAIGYLARVAPEKADLHVIDWCKRTYFAADDERIRRIVGEVVQAFSKRATDNFRAIAATAMPFVFVAKHDSNEHIKELFQEIWNDIAGGPRTVILYLPEIINLVTIHLDSPRWSMKHAAARSVATATISMAEAAGDINLASSDIIWPALEKALAGKTWEGKEVVLAAFAVFVEKSTLLWRQKQEVRAKMREIVIREARRQVEGYRPHALRALARVTTAMAGTVDLGTTVLDIVGPLLQDMTQNHGSATDEGSSEGASAMKANLREDITVAAAVEALFSSAKAWVRTDSEFLPRVVELLDLSITANTVNSARVVKLATCRGCYELLVDLLSKSRLIDAQEQQLTKKLGEQFQSILLSGPINVHDIDEELRLQWAEAVVKLLTFLEKAQQQASAAALRDEIMHVRANEQSAAIRKVLEQSGASARA